MSTDYNAFIYLVARRGLHAPGKATGRIPKSLYYPVVLMVKEQNGLWGVPGGMSDTSDRGDPMDTATREFQEETGADVSWLTQHTSMFMTMNRPHSKHIVVLFDGWAEHAEQVLGMRHRGLDNVSKASVRLSKEALGYAWVSLDLLKTASQHGNHTLLSMDAHPTDRGRAIKLRNHRVCDQTSLQSMLDLCASV